MDSNTIQIIPLRPIIGNGWIINLSQRDDTLVVKLTFGIIMGEEALDKFRVEITNLDIALSSEIEKIEFDLEEFLEIPLPLFITLSLFESASKYKTKFIFNESSSLEEDFKKFKLKM